MVFSGYDAVFAAPTGPSRRTCSEFVRKTRLVQRENAIATELRSLAIKDNAIRAGGIKGEFLSDLEHDDWRISRREKQKLVNFTFLIAVRTERRDPAIGASAVYSG